MDFAVVEVDPDARVADGLVEPAISAVAHVSSLRAHDDWLLGDHVNRPARRKRLLLAAQIPVHSEIAFWKRLASVGNYTSE